MGEDAADIGDQPLGLGEKLGPGGCGHRAHEDGAVLHVREIGRGQNQAGAGGDLAGTGNPAAVMLANDSPLPPTVSGSAASVLS